MSARAPAEQHRGQLPGQQRLFGPPPTAEQQPGTPAAPPSGGAVDREPPHNATSPHSQTSVYEMLDQPANTLR